MRKMWKRDQKNLVSVDSIAELIPNLIVYVSLLHTQSRLIIHIVIQNSKFAFFLFVTFTNAAGIF